MASSEDGLSDTKLADRVGVLLWLAGPFASPPRATQRTGSLAEIEDQAHGELLLSEAGLRALADAEQRIQELAPGESAVALLQELFGDLRISDDLRSALRQMLDVREICGHIIYWGGSLADKAVAVLSIKGEPMMMDEIHEALGFHVNPRSMAGQVQQEQRIMRRGKSTYGLREWGGEEYSGIAEELEQAIERAGGSVDLEAVVESFVRQFGISAQSVRSYAAGRGFVKGPDGKLRLRGAQDDERPFRSLPMETTPAVYLIDELWHLRIEVDSEVMRGSGRPIRSSIALAAGLEPDLRLGFDYDGTTVVFSWAGTQPNLGSVRGVAGHHGCGDGDLLFLPLGGPEPRRCHVVHWDERVREQGLSRLVIEMGQDPDGADDDRPSTAVLAALGLPAGGDWVDVIDRVRDRQDVHLLEHVPAGW